MAGCSKKQYAIMMSAGPEGEKLASKMGSMEQEEFNKAFDELLGSSGGSEGTEGTQKINYSKDDDEDYAEFDADSDDDYGFDEEEEVEESEDSYSINNLTKDDVENRLREELDLTNLSDEDLEKAHSILAEMGVANKLDRDTILSDIIGEEEDKGTSDLSGSRPNEQKLNDLGLSDSEKWNMAYEYIGRDKLEKLAEKNDLSSPQDLSTEELLKSMSDEEIADMMRINGLDDDEEIDEIEGSEDDSIKQQLQETLDYLGLDFGEGYSMEDAVADIKDSGLSVDDWVARMSNGNPELFDNDEKDIANKTMKTFGISNFDLVEDALNEDSSNPEVDDSNPEVADEEEYERNKKQFKDFIVNHENYKPMVSAIKTEKGLMEKLNKQGYLDRKDHHRWYKAIQEVSKLTRQIERDYEDKIGMGHFMSASAITEHELMEGEGNPSTTNPSDNTELNEEQTKKVNHIIEYFQAWGRPGRIELQDVINFYGLTKPMANKVFTTLGIDKEDWENLKFKE